MTHRHLDNAIDKLKLRLLDLCAVVEERVGHAVQALESHDIALARTVIDGDDEVDRAEVDIEEDCLKTLALNQPVAGDLRAIVSFLKINNDLERIADLAVHIAERAIEIDSLLEQDLPFNFHDMSGKVRAMLKRSLDAVLNQDVGLARRVMQEDDAIDQMHRDSYNAIADHAVANPAKIHLLLNALSVSRYLERIADHATNIAEDAVYMLQGDIVRHRDAM